MSKKAIALSFVMVLCISSLFVALVDESSMAETKGTLRPYSQEKVKYSTNSIMFTTGNYESAQHGSTYIDRNFNPNYTYYGKDPSEDIQKFLDGKADFIEGLSVDQLEANHPYWAFCTHSWSDTSDWVWREASMSLSGIFLPRGKYTIEFSASDDMKDTISYLRCRSPYYESSSFSDGKGTITVNASTPMTVFLNTNKNGPTTEIERFKWKVDYKISPSLPEQRTVECTDSQIITTDQYWTLYETVDTFEPGTYRVSSNSCAAFVKGSASETDFVTNVVNKGLTDLPAMSDRVVVTSTSKIDIYMLKDIDDSDYIRSSLNIYPEGTGYGRDYDCTVTEFKQNPYKFYAGQNFSIAVSYDTAKYSYVILKSSQCTIYMESGKVYDIQMGNASEYELLGVVKSGNAPITPFSVGLYTENIASPDDSGMIFAGVAIAFCAIAFFLLFYFGRRPKWDDSTGLPVGGMVETVVNEASEEIPETPAKETPPEQPPEE